jgi:hypothetical protein
MALPYLQEYGWDAHVLTVHPGFVPNEQDSLLEQTLPAKVKRTSVTPFSERWTRRVGLGSLGWRCYRAMQKAGNQMLAEGSFDLVFFSTTEFPVIGLGAGWKARFDVPFVFDLQDPWVSDYYTDADAPIPPGGRFKYAVMQALARYQEPRALRACAGVVSVSPAYPGMLAKRYAWFDQGNCEVLPFAAPGRDFEILASSTVPLPDYFTSWQGMRWVYVGRGGPDMAFALQAFMRALAAARSRDPLHWNKLRIFFIGTDYAPGARARQSVLPVAVKYGVGDLVVEHPQRIPYFQGLACLKVADALVVPGSDDPFYTASKVYPYIQAEKPLLAIFHEQSSVVSLLEKTRAGTLIPFVETSLAESNRLSGLIADQWFNGGHCQQPDTNWKAFAPYTAKEMTRKLCAFFDRAIGGP